MIITKTVTVKQDVEFELDIIEEILSWDNQKIIEAVVDLDRSVASWEYSIPVLIALMKEALKLSPELYDVDLGDLYKVTKNMKKTLKKLIKEKNND